MFTFKGRPRKEVYLIANGYYSDPYNSLEQIYVDQNPEPLGEDDHREFIEETLEVPTEITGETHRQWLAGQPPASTAKH